MKHLLINFDKTEARLGLIILAFVIMFDVVSECQAQESNKIIYTEVVACDSVSKEDLYLKAKQWFATSYNNSKAVLQIDDKEPGQLVGKALLTYNPAVFVGSDGTRGVINYTIKIFVKDGRYKYEISDFTHEPNSYSGAYSFGLITNDLEYQGTMRGANKNWCSKVWLDIKSQIDPYAKRLVLNLKEGMSAKIEDW